MRKIVTKVHLVTGSCGFIGHHLVKALREDDPDCWVIGVDNLVNGNPQYATLSNEFFPMDIHELDVGFVENHLIDNIFHLAALPRVSYSIDKPVETDNINTNGTAHILNLARLMKDKGRPVKVIYSSSSSIYGAQSDFPTKEDAEYSPMNPYALQKLAGDYYCDIFNKIFGIETVALRYFNVYGEDQDGSHPYATVVSKFLDLKAKEMPLTIHGDGEQTRDMTYVGDVARANILAAKEGITGAFNIGGGKAYSVNQIAKMIGGPTVSEPARVGEAKHTLADITRAKKVLGWKPKTNLKTWLEKD